MGVLLLLITTICAVTSSYRLDCTSALIDLAPCLDYVTDSANCPSPECCKQFVKLIETQPLCVCAAVDGTASRLLGMTVDADRAVGLPLACEGLAIPGLVGTGPKEALRNQLKRNADGVNTSVAGIP